MKECFSESGNAHKASDPARVWTSRGWDRARGGSREPWNLPEPSQSNPFWDSMILPPFPGKCPEDGPSWLMQNLAPLASDFGCRTGGTLNPLILEGTPWAGASQGSTRLWEAQRSHGIPWREGTESGSSWPLSAMSRHGNPGLATDRAGKGPVFPITGTAFPGQLSRGPRVENGVTWGDWRWQRAGAEGRGGRSWNHGITRVGRDPPDHPQQHHQRWEGRSRSWAPARAPGPPFPGPGSAEPGWPGRLRPCPCADVGALPHRDLPPVQNPGKAGWGRSRGVPSPGQGRGRIRGIGAREAPGTRPQRLLKLPRGRAEPPERLSQPGAAAAEGKGGSSLKTGMCTRILRDAPPGVLYRCRFSPRCSIPTRRDPCV